MAILSALFEAAKPLTQQQIAERLAEDAPDKVTIYRTLETLVEANIVHKAYLQERVWHFELAHNCTRKQCHPHFTCLECGRNFCMTELKVPFAKSPYKGFRIEHQQVRLEGLCPECS
jgi:Fe2+ or Zn2+ uptake regulation protein